MHESDVAVIIDTPKKQSARRIIPMDQAWEQLTPEEKRKERFRWWLHPQGVEFVDGKAEKAYIQRAGRLIDAYNVEEPDQVPVSVAVGAIPAYQHGSDSYTAMYDYD